VLGGYIPEEPPARHPGVQARFNYDPQQFAQALSAANGPGVGLAGFGSEAPPEPRVDMAGFGSTAYPEPRVEMSGFPQICLSGLSLRFRRPRSREKCTA
jgi:hypothetical protein